MLQLKSTYWLQPRDLQTRRLLPKCFRTLQLAKAPVLLALMPAEAQGQPQNVCALT